MHTRGVRRRGSPPTALAVWLALGVSACESSSGRDAAADVPGSAREDAGFRDLGPADTGPARAIDAQPADAAPEDAGSPFDGLGTSCPAGACAAGLTCIDDTLIQDFSTSGYCTLACVSDADCGPGICLTIVDTVRICALPCDAADACADPRRVCTRRLAGMVDLGRGACLPGTATATSGARCASLEDCNRDSLCVTSHFEAPNGACVVFGCTPGDNASCGPAGGHCVLIDPVNGVCLGACMDDRDCRESEGYGCYYPEFLGSRACLGPPRRAPGDGCLRDSECGPAPWVCRTGPEWPDGYCSVLDCDTTAPSCNRVSCPSPRSCPPDGLCYEATPGVPGSAYCLRGCGTNNDCRYGPEGRGYSCELIDPDFPSGPKGCFLRPLPGPDGGTDGGS